MVNKKYLFLFAFLILCSLSFSVSAFSNKTVYRGATFILTNDTYEDFRNYVYGNASECMMDKAETTYFNQSRVMNLGCHIALTSNGTIIDIKGFYDDKPFNRINWENIVLIFWIDNPNFNRSWSAITMTNNTELYVNTSFIITHGNDSIETGNSKTPKGLGLTYDDRYIATTPETIARSSYYGNNLSNAKQIFYGVAMAHFEYNTSSNPVFTTGSTSLMFNHFTNLTANHTFFKDVGTAGLAYDDGGFGLGVISHIDNIKDFTSIASSTGMYHPYGTVYKNPAKSVYLMHGITQYCMVPAVSSLIGEFQDSVLQCGPNGFFGFASTTLLNLTDSEIDYPTGGGFLAAFNLYFYNTLKYDFIDKYYKPVKMEYNISSRTNQKYNSTYANNLTQKIMTRQCIPSGCTNYNPFYMNVTNSSYMSYSNYTLNITGKQQGLWFVQPWYNYIILRSDSKNYLKL